MKAPESVLGGYIELDKPLQVDDIKVIGVCEGLGNSSIVSVRLPVVLCGLEYPTD